MAPEDIRELFRAFGPVTVRRMFGGAGIYAEGTMFALVSDGAIYLKADQQSAPAFEREKLEPFVYATKTGRRAVMSYRRMPDRLYDDPDELAAWARAALTAAHRKPTAARPAAKKRSGTTRRP